MYEKAFNGKIRCMITYGEANDPAYIPLLKENQKDYIYHSELILDNQRIIMSDHVDIEFQTCYSNFLTIMYDTKEEVQRAYEIMKEGSKTIYRLEATPYSSCRVVFVDRFGIRWGIMTEYTRMACGCSKHFSGRSSRPSRFGCALSMQWSGLACMMLPTDLVKSGLERSQTTSTHCLLR